MLHDLSSYQVDALVQLTAYRQVFYNTRLSFPLKKISNDPVQGFIAIFCEHNFADTDYSIIQREPLGFDTLEDWVSQASLPAILKCFTYYIWTDKIVEGYFKTRIENKIVDKLLLRLEILLKQENAVF